MSNDQAVLQLVYLMATGSGSMLVIVSTIFSLVTLTITVAADDAYCLGWSLMNSETRCKWLMLYLWRAMDIPPKLVMYTLFYNSDGGGILTFVVFAMNCVVGGCVYFNIMSKLRYASFVVSLKSFLFSSMKVFAFARDKKANPPTTALLLPAVTPLSFGDTDGYTRRDLLQCVWLYGVVESITMVFLLWTKINPFDAAESWIFGLAVFASVGSLTKWLCLYGLLVMTDGETYDVNQEKTDLKSLYESGNQWCELADVILFKINDLRTACRAIFVESRHRRFHLLHINSIRERNIVRN